MADQPTAADLEEALQRAGQAHHRYEREYLGGARDEAWAGWYAAYLLGRLGGFAPPADLTRWLESSPYEKDWNRRTAALIHNKLAES